jgi:predicted kinase
MRRFYHNAEAAQQQYPHERSIDINHYPFHQILDIITDMNDGQLAADVKKLMDSLEDLPEPSVDPALIVVSGLPGSGKSYFSRRLAERLPFPIIESDAMRQILAPQPSYSPGESERLFRACHALIGDLLRKGISLIFDATNLIERNREQLYRIADSADAKLILVRVEAPPELVRQRLERRQMEPDQNDKSDADWKVYQKMTATAERIRRNHFAVDTSKDIAPAIEKIVREARR